MSQPPPILDADRFLQVVRDAPLIAIDLVATDSRGRILVGRRTNEPARGTWFVPGGSVGKDERLDDAFRRIADNELGTGEWSRASARFIGVFEHFYDTNFAGRAGVTTHYVVLAYHLAVDHRLTNSAPRDQHSDYLWLSEDAASAGSVADVHPATKAYFDHIEPGLSPTQYKIANARRDRFNALLWQTPALTLTGLAFVFTVLLTASSPIARWLSAGMAMAMCIAAFQLMGKHRYNEKYLAVFLSDYERRSGKFELNRKVEVEPWLTGRSSVAIWRRLFVLLFVVAGLGALLLSVWPPP